MGFGVSGDGGSSGEVRVLFQLMFDKSVNHFSFFLLFYSTCKPIFYHHHNCHYQMFTLLLFLAINKKIFIFLTHLINFKYSKTKDKSYKNYNFIFLKNSTKAVYTV